MLEPAAIQSWLDNWIAQDFSWDGLTTKPPVKKIGGANLQETLRAIHGNYSDEQLTADGWLINIDERGAYHVAFIPREWASDENIDKKKLEKKKNEFWDTQFARADRERLNDRLWGFQLTAEASASIASITQAHCWWVRFEGDVAPPVAHPKRVFNNCLVEHQVRYSGKSKPDSSPDHRFEQCVVNSLWLSQSFGLGRLEVSGTCKTINLSQSRLTQLSIGECSSDFLSVSQCEIDGEFSVRGCTIGQFDLADSEFHSPFILGETKIEGYMTIWSCDFDRRTTIIDIVWPKPGLEKALAKGSTFSSMVEISGESPPPVQLFNQAYLEKGLSLENFTDKQWRASFDGELKSTDAATWKKFNEHEHAEALEGGCRTLRSIAEAAGNIHAEHLWRRFEIIARRKRPDCSRTERLFSHAYGLLADYGLSIPRPFVGLLITIGAFAGLYAWFGSDEWFGARLSWEAIGQGLSFSLHRTFPFGVFGDATNSWREALLGQTGSGTSILMRSVATLQSVVAAVLIFLGVMAVRRKFKIG